MGGAKPLHSHPPLLSPADSSAQFEMGTQASPAPPVRPWNQVSVAQHTQTPLRAASQREPPELRPCVPPRCPTAGTPVVPLVPLVRSLRAWLALPSPSRWLIRTIRLGYAIQFARHPPRFRGVHFTSVKAVDTHVLRAEIAVLLAKDAIELVPPADMTFSPWSDPLFLRAGVALEQVSRHAVVFTDASATGWGATYNGQAVSGVWTGPQRHWHINCLELLAVYLALGRLKGPLRGKNVLVRTDC